MLEKMRAYTDKCYDSKIKDCVFVDPKTGYCKKRILCKNFSNDGIDYYYAPRIVYGIKSDEIPQTKCLENLVACYKCKGKLGLCKPGGLKHNQRVFL